MSTDVPAHIAAYRNVLDALRLNLETAQNTARYMANIAGLSAGRRQVSANDVAIATRRLGDLENIETAIANNVQDIAIALDELEEVAEKPFVVPRDRRDVAKALDNASIPYLWEG